MESTISLTLLFNKFMYTSNRGNWPRTSEAARSLTLAVLLQDAIDSGVNEAAGFAEDSVNQVQQLLKKPTK